MALPWVSRLAHEAICRIYESQLGELRAERVILLDRLASIGLGGPLFDKPEVGESPEEEEAELVDPDAEVKEMLAATRHRPSKRAAWLTYMAQKEAQAKHPLPKVAWIPDEKKRDQQERVNARLDAAEAAGKEQAS